jgi:hypothetical protein
MLATGIAVLSNILNNMVYRQLQEYMNSIVFGGIPGNLSGVLGRTLSVSDNIRIRTISALTDQYQRLAIAAPIATSPQGFRFCDVCNCTNSRAFYHCTSCYDYDMVRNFMCIFTTQVLIWSPYSKIVLLVFYESPRMPHANPPFSQSLAHPNTKALPRRI